MPRPKLVLIGIFAINLVFIAAVVFSGMLRHDDPLFEFDEKGLVTWFSTIQLFLLGLLCLGIYIVRLQQERRFISWNVIWLILAVGFIFLALDEKFMFHEHLDDSIKYHLHIKENALNDRLDDLIIGIYGLAGIGLLYIFRHELATPAKFRPVIIFGFLALFAMVAFDAITNRRDVVSAIFSDDLTARKANMVMAFFEEALKLLAEGAFFSAMYARLHQFLKGDVPE